MVAAVKGSKSDMKVRVLSHVKHNAKPAALKFAAGNPGSQKTVNGYFFDIKFKPGMYHDLTTEITKYFEKTAKPLPEKCQCGGTVMTP
jgi:hypothetical protein